MTIKAEGDVPSSMGDSGKVGERHRERTETFSLGPEIDYCEKKHENVVLEANNTWR
jgi:hypothetical protein